MVHPLDLKHKSNKVSAESLGTHNLTIKTTNMQNESYEYIESDKSPNNVRSEKTKKLNKLDKGDLNSEPQSISRAV